MIGNLLAGLSVHVLHNVSDKLDIEAKLSGEANNLT